jgi:hypothetical protein
MTPPAEVVTLTKEEYQAEPPKSSADSFVFEIRKEMEAAASAETTALAAAIRCGLLLIKAKENLKAERKGNRDKRRKWWIAWLEQHEFNRRTAALYKRLADHEDDIREAGYTSIREADKGLRLTPDDDGSDDAATNADGEGTDSDATSSEMSNGVAQNGARGRAPPGRHSRSKRQPSQSQPEAVLEDALTDLVPLEVFNILRAKWTPDDLDKLGELIAEHLHSRQEAHEHELA